MELRSHRLEQAGGRAVKRQRRGSDTPADPTTPSVKTEPRCAFKASKFFSKTDGVTSRDAKGKCHRGDARGAIPIQEWVTVGGEWWFSVALSPIELVLETTLMSGMSFRWQPVRIRDGESPEPGLDVAYDSTTPTAHEKGSAAAWTLPSPEHDIYIGVVGDVALALTQTNEGAVFRLLRHSTGVPAGAAGYRRALKQLHWYLNGHIDRTALDRVWTSRDAAFADRIGLYPGMRVLTIEPVECILTFLGSANNSIKRNAKMVATLCLCFPENKIGNVTEMAVEMGDAPGIPRGARISAGDITTAQLALASVYRFPTLTQLASLSEEEYWTLGWGYRAPRIIKAIAQLQEWTSSKRLIRVTECGYVEAREALETLVGVGRKVADCICLIGLRHFDAIPVDTHCFQFAQRYSYIGKRESTVTKSTHNAVGDRLREIFGQSAGWAFMVLFVAEVHPFRIRAQHLRMTYTAKKVVDEEHGSARRHLAF